MPLYRCNVAPGLAGFEQRSLLAKEVTRIHVDVMGGLETFVHTFFEEDDALPEGRRAVLLGSVRAGRNDEQKRRLVAELGEAASRALGVPSEAVRVATVDVPAKWIMEGGDVLPEPGDEAEWLAEHGGGAQPSQRPSREPK